MKQPTAILIISCALAILTIFQVALILGLPIGHASWGGQYRVLPMGLRIASAGAIIIYGTMYWVTRQRIKKPESRGYEIGVWIIAVYFLLSIFLNLISASNWEKIWAPVCLVLTWAFYSLARLKKHNS